MGLQLSSETINTFDVVVSKKPNHGQFRTITEAIEYAPTSGVFRIYIEPGIYDEKIVINRNNIHLIGAGRDKVIISHTLVAAMEAEDGDILGTFRTQTLEVRAVGFVAQSLTIRNGFDYLANAEKPASDPSKLLEHTQAMAVLLAKESDKAAFHDVALEGYQDTFCCLGGRAYFSQSAISGTVDFIFGSGRVVFNDCDIIARYRPVKDEVMGYITAPSTDHTQTFGLVFFHCRLTKENEQVKANSYALGRPWHPTTTFLDGRYADPNAIGHACFLHSEMDDHIFGWDKMQGTSIRGERIWFLPDQHARFSEHGTRGKGSSSEGFRPQLGEDCVSQYIPEKILSGWMPSF